MRFDLTDLKLFLRIAESGSITAGAEHTHLALASASARIRGMEDTLGVPLLLRTRRGVEPTDAGRTLLHHARIITLQMERMRADLGEFASGLKGHIRLLCNTSALTEFLPDPLAAFMAAHPQVSIDMDERTSVNVVQGMRDKLADIGIASDAIDTSGLETLPFREDRLVVALAPGHPAAKGLRRNSSVPFASVLEHDFVGLAGDSALQTYIAEQANRLGAACATVCGVRSFDAVCRIAASGTGIAVLPESAVLRSRDAGTLKIIRLSDRWASRRLLVCMHSYEALPGYARELVNLLAQEHRQHEGGQ